MIIHVDFLALIFFMIYIGAVVVLFLFVVMMVDIKVSAANLINTSPISIKVLLLNLFLMFFLFTVDQGDLDLLINYNINNNKVYWTIFPEYIDFASLLNKTSNLQNIGKFLYRYHNLSFLIAGLLLYIAMVGAIYLTIDRKGPRLVKMQSASTQTLRRNTIFSNQFVN